MRIWSLCSQILLWGSGITSVIAHQATERDASRSRPKSGIILLTSESTGGDSANNASCSTPPAVWMCPRGKLTFLSPQ